MPDYDVDEAYAAVTAGDFGYFAALPVAVFNTAVVTSAPAPPSQRGRIIASYPAFVLGHVNGLASDLLVPPVYPLVGAWSDPNPVTNQSAGFIGTAPDESLALEIRYTPGEMPLFVDAFIPLTTGVGLGHAGIKFEVWTPTGFDYGPNGSGGKIGGGLWGGGQNSTGGDAPWTTQDGTTIRNVWDQDADSLDMRIYTYNLNRSITTGLSGPQISGKLASGRWQTFEYEGSINEPGEANGFGRFWIDDECIGEITSAIWAINYEWRWRGVIISDAWQTGTINQAQTRWIRNLTFYNMDPAMTNPLRIARENDIDNAIVSAGASVSTLPASHVKTKDIKQLWRSGAGSTYLLADLGQNLTTQYVLVVNCIADNSIRVRVSVSDPTGVAGDAYDSSLVTSGWTTIERMILHFIEPSAFGRYVRIDGLTEAGRLASGEVFAPTRDMSLGVEYLWRDFSRRVQMPAGHEFIERRNRQKGYRFTIRGLTEAEAEGEVYTLNRINGASQDILVCRDKNALNAGSVSIWGLLEQPAVVRETNTPGFFEVEFALWQRL